MGKIDYVRVPRQNRLHAPAHISDSLSVHDPNLENSPGAAFLDVIWNQIAEVLWPKAVQVELTGDRQRDRLARKWRLFILAET